MQPKIMCDELVTLEMIGLKPRTRFEPLVSQLRSSKQFWCVSMESVCDQFSVEQGQAGNYVQSVCDNTILTVINW